MKDLHAGSCRISQIAYARILSASRNQEYSDPDDGDRVLDVRRISVLYLLNRCARKHTRAQGSKWYCKNLLSGTSFQGKIGTGSRPLSGFANAMMLCAATRTHHPIAIMMRLVADGDNN